MIIDKLLRKLVDDQYFMYEITPEQMIIIGYDPDVDPNWPSHKGLVDYARAKVETGGG